VSVPRRIPVAKPSFDEEEERLVCDALRSGWVTQGPRVEEFERRLAGAVGAAEAVAVSSGTAALFLSLHALGIGPGAEVIVPSLSFIASANAIVHCGATPVFVDVDPRTYNIDPSEVAAAITPRTRAVLVVHQLGMPADLDRIEHIARPRDIRVIEDAACAIGSRFKGRPVGSSGNPVAFSFHPRKVLVTGEGGMITTNDADLAARLRRLRHQGMSVSDMERHRGDRVIIEEYPEIGYNYRLSDLHAALGLAQLTKLDRFLDRRRALAARYHTALRELESVEPPVTPDYAEPNFQSYIVRLRDADQSLRDRVLNEMQRRGVATRRGLMASHHEPCYRGARRSGSLPHTTAAAQQTMILPMYPDLTEDDQAYVMSALRDVIRSLRSETGMNHHAGGQAR
jgi:perosamine synthetase